MELVTLNCGHITDKFAFSLKQRLSLHEGQRDTEGRQPCEGEGRDQSEAFINHGITRTADHHQQLTETVNRYFLKPLEGTTSAHTLILDF